jgi:hypothetical protein
METTKMMQPGQLATLISPYLGYRIIELIEKLEYKWLVRIVCSGKEILVYDDEFTIN